MRRLVALFALCLAISPAVKPDQHTNESKTASNREREPSAVVVNNESASAHTYRQPEQRPQWYRTVSWSNWALVLVALITACAVFKQARDTAKAAEATRISAEANLSNIQTIINVERARVVAELVPICQKGVNGQWYTKEGTQLTDLELIAGKHHVYRLKILNLGRTPAHIFSYEVNFGPLIEGTRFSAETLESKRFVNVNYFLPSGKLKSLEDVGMLDTFTADTKTGAFCVTVKYGDLISGKEEHRTSVVYYYSGADSSLDRITAEDRYT
jgi:hypothetical protein